MTFRCEDVNLHDPKNNFNFKLLREGNELFVIHTLVGAVHRDIEDTLWEAVCNPAIEVIRADVFEKGRQPTKREFLRGGMFYIVGKPALMMIKLAASEAINSISVCEYTREPESIEWSKYDPVL